MAGLGDECMSVRGLAHSSHSTRQDMITHVNENKHLYFPKGRNEMLLEKKRRTLARSFIFFEKNVDKRVLSDREREVGKS